MKWSNVVFATGLGKALLQNLKRSEPCIMIYVVNMCRIDKYIEYAGVLAHNSVMRYRLGAVLIKSGKIIGAGRNHKKYSHMAKDHWSQTIHAEVDAILKSDKSPRGSTLFLSRILKNGSTALSKPCEACIRVMKEERIKSVYYTTAEGIEWLKIT